MCVGPKFFGSASSFRLATPPVIAIKGLVTQALNFTYMAIKINAKRAE